MAYRLRRNKSVQKSIRKIAAEQIDKAIAEINNESLDRHEVVHQVRKRCKKLRGLIRLVRPNFDQYSEENAAFRDIARELSFARDAQSMLECFDDLLDHFVDQIDPDAFTPLREILRDRRDEVAADEEGLAQQLENTLNHLQEARTRVDSWKIDETGFPALAGGLQKTYGRACDAIEVAYADPTAENFHEWRKRVKYHWYHTRLLRRIWEPMLKPQRRAAAELADLLGDEHDLAVLRETLLSDPERFGEGADVQAIVGLIDRRRKDFQEQAKPLGRRLFSESPSRLGRRFEGYWNVWREL
ncbi:MAG: CHAD domain-containing protein [Rubinisphaera brasiliensis]|uniref:CHAD domain-containing protein n=1 Tax=Rubinisphaera brasiliensis TaxID=119 RepID=UPI00391B2F9B